MYATPKKNKRICNILIFQNIFETITFIHIIYTNTAQTFVYPVGIVINVQLLIEWPGSMGDT